MFIATVTVDLSGSRYCDSSRVEVELGLSDDDALFAYNKSWYKITRTIAKLTPWRVTVRDVQFSPEDRDRLIAMTEEVERDLRELGDFVLTCEDCGSTTVCEHIADIIDHTCGPACGSAGYCVVLG